MHHRKSTFYLSDRSLGRLDAIQGHYKKAHGLDLTSSAVIRRALDSLFLELNLHGNVSPDDSAFMARLGATMGTGNPPTPEEQARLIDIWGRHGGSLPPETELKVQEMAKKLGMVPCDSDA